jgi:hypothetical protein
LWRKNHSLIKIKKEKGIEKRKESENSMEMDAHAATST